MVRKIEMIVSKGVAENRSKMNRKEKREIKREGEKKGERGPYLDGIIIGEKLKEN